MARIYSKQTKESARNLRIKGWSLGEINLKMKIPKNTLSGWFKDILLSKEQNKLFLLRMLFAKNLRILLLLRDQTNLF